MPRKPRLFYESKICHVMQRGNNKQKIFIKYSDYYRYLNILEKYKQTYKIKIYAYCLMPNHIHLLIKHNGINGLSKMIQCISLSYYQWHKKQYSFVGHLFQGRFKSMPINNESYLLECSRYIELNPVRANLVLDPSGWNWSSYNFYAFGTKNKILDCIKHYIEFGKDIKSRQKKYRDFVFAKMQMGTLPNRG